MSMGEAPIFYVVNDVVIDFTHTYSRRQSLLL